MNVENRVWCTMNKINSPIYFLYIRAARFGENVILLLRNGLSDPKDIDQLVQVCFIRVGTNAVFQAGL